MDVKDALRPLLALVYPYRCGSCGSRLGAGEKFFCCSCLKGVKRVDGPSCTVCGRPFPGGAGGEHPCSGCMASPPPFARARAPLIYDGVVKEAIHLYKYRSFRSLRDYLGGFIEEGALRWFRDATVVSAVPLHKRRLRHRGFNQSLFLARRAAKAIGARLSIDGLARIRHTRPQVELKSHEREANVRGAFAVVRPEEFDGGDVLLVDDVYTTGATVKECASVLRKAGVRSVSVLTIARVFRE